MEHYYFYPATALIVGAIVALFLALCSASTVSGGKRKRTADILERQRHVFLDLETMAMESNAAVLTIGACCYDLLGNEQSSFYVRVDPEDAKRYGVFTQGTLTWWRGQADEAIEEAFVRAPRFPLHAALDQLDEWFEKQGKISGVWGSGIRADNVWVAEAYRALDRETPWDFRVDRDCRTVVMLDELAGQRHKEDALFTGQRHNAADDARHQASYTIAAIRSLLDAE